MHQRNVLLKPVDEIGHAEMDVMAAELVLEDLLGRGRSRSDHRLIALNGCHLQTEVLAHQLLNVLPLDGLHNMLFRPVLLEGREAVPLERCHHMALQERLVRLHRIERLDLHPVHIRDNLRVYRRLDRQHRIPL